MDRASVLSTPLILLGAFCILLMLPSDSLGQRIFQLTSQQDKALANFLRDYLGKPDPSLESQGPTRYAAAFVDLRDNGTKEVIVYITGDWCGTGGCNTLVLAPKGTSYEVITNLTITWPPVRVLATKSHGWHDISVWVQGGGIQPGYEAKLSFDGKTYPSNPSVPPAQQLKRKVLGKTLNFDEPGNLLYPRVTRNFP